MVFRSGMSSLSDRVPPQGAMDERVSPLAPPPEAQADLALMAAVAAKDPVAERELLHRIGGRVRRITGLLCPTAADADDAAQLALIEILKSAGGFRVATSLEGWTDRIAARTTLRAARRERERRGLLTRWLRPDSQPWGSMTTNEGDAIGLDGLLERLSPDRRSAFVLHHALEYTVDEIAELTQSPVGTVKDRLVNARKELRQMLERGSRRGGVR